MGLQLNDLQQRRSYLEKLFSDISTIRPGELKPNMAGGKAYSIWLINRKRAITEDELVRFMAYAPHFIVEPVTSQYGFNFGLRLYNFPKTDEEKPEPFFFISGEYLPKEVGQSFEDAWRVFSPLSHNRNNKLFLMAYGLNLPKEKSHYSY